MYLNKKIFLAAAFSLLGLSAPVMADQSDNENNITTKMNTYIDCYNKKESVTRSIERYSSWVDLKKGPTGKENIAYGLYSVNVDALVKCEKKIKEAAALEPKLSPLDEDAVVFADTQLAIGQQIDKMYPYYDQEDYKDDKFAKGKEMHPDFATKVDAFMKADEKFSDSIEEYNGQRQADQLVQIEKEEGRKDNYYGLAILLEAEKLLNIVQDDSFKPEDAQAAIDSYSTLLDAADKYLADNPELTRSITKNILSNAKDVLKTSKDRYRHVRDNKKYSESELSKLGTSAGWMVKGGPDIIIKNYNSMVADYNRG